MCYVNFVREHMAFIEFASDKNLTGNERTFWYALIHIMNQRANGSDWPEDFISIPNSRLLSYVPFSENKIQEIRNRLKQLGLIDFRKGDRNKRAPEYKMVYFSAVLSTGNEQNGESCHRFGGNFGGNFGSNFGGNFGGNFGKKTGATSGAETGTLYLDLNDTVNRNPKPNAYEDDDDEEEAERARMRGALGDCINRTFQQCLGRMPVPIERQQLIRAAENNDMPCDLVEQAIGKAALRSAKSPALYAMELMSDWNYRKIHTIYDLVELERM